MLNLTYAPPGPPIEEKVKIIFLNFPCPLELVSLLEEKEAVKDPSRTEYCILEGIENVTSGSYFNVK